MEYLLSKQFITSLIIIVGSLFLWNVLKKFLSRQKIFKTDNGIQANFVNSVVGYVLLAIVVVTVLEINGIDVSSLIAGLGIVGIVVGFALQDFLKDIVAGTNIVWNNLFKIGDIIKYGDVEGEVIYFSLRITKVIDIKTGNTVIISNRNVSDIEIMSKILGIDVPASYDEDVNHMREVLQEIVEKAKSIEHVENAEFIQTQSFEASAILYKIKIICEPKYRYGVRRNVLALVQDVYKKYNLSIPYDQLDVHLIK